MRWADYEFRFVRPIRWMVALFGDQIIPVEICGVKSGKFSMGHRFMQQSLKDCGGKPGLTQRSAQQSWQQSLFCSGRS